MGQYWEQNFVSRNDWDDSLPDYDGPAPDKALLLPTGGIIFHYVFTGTQQCQQEFHKNFWNLIIGVSDKFIIRISQFSLCMYHKDLEKREEFSCTWVKVGKIYM